MRSIAWSWSAQSCFVELIFQGVVLLSDRSGPHKEPMVTNWGADHKREGHAANLGSPGETELGLLNRNVTGTETEKNVKQRTEPWTVILGDAKLMSFRSEA